MHSNSFSLKRSLPQPAQICGKKICLIPSATFRNQPDTFIILQVSFKKDTCTIHPPLSWEQFQWYNLMLLLLSCYNRKSQFFQNPVSVLRLSFVLFCLPPLFLRLSQLHLQSKCFP